MIEDHEKIDEILSGYALQSLTGDDAREADRLLSDHVPSCERCRQTLADFQAITGDLALAAEPARPPDLLWPRIRSSMKDRPVSRNRWAVFALAASLVAILGLGSWNVFLTSRASDAVDDRTQLTTMLKRMLSGDGSRMVTLRDEHFEPQLLVYYLPGIPRTRVVGINVPPPDEGHVYRIWLLHENGTKYLGQFVPSEGLVWRVYEIDLSDYRQVVITEESGGAAGHTPAAESRVRWEAVVYAS
jgi:hypothetical protein